MVVRGLLVDRLDQINVLVPVGILIHLLEGDKIHVSFCQDGRDPGEVTFNIFRGVESLIQ